MLDVLLHGLPDHLKSQGLGFTPTPEHAQGRLIRRNNSTASPAPIAALMTL